MAAWAAKEEQVARLMQITGIGLVSAVTILAAIGDVHRFPCANQLVGYSGLGVTIHDSGQTTRTGGITKAGRKDLRTALVEAAHTAVIHDARWKAELKRLEPRTGYNKAIVAIARKMLVLIWHLLTEPATDRQVDTERVARKFLEFAYTLDQATRGKSASAFVRDRLDVLGLGQDLTSVSNGSHTFKLPPSHLTG